MLAATSQLNDRGNLKRADVSKWFTCQFGDGAAAKAARASVNPGLRTTTSPRRRRNRDARLATRKSSAARPRWDIPRRRVAATPRRRRGYSVETRRRRFLSTPAAAAADDPSPGPAQTHRKDQSDAIFAKYLSGTAPSVAKIDFPTIDLCRELLPGEEAEKHASVKKSGTMNLRGTKARQSGSIRAATWPLTEQKVKDLGEQGSTAPDAFNKLDQLVMGALGAYMPAFKSSEECTELVQFLFRQQNTLGDEDFNQFRILGKGGFGMVYGCRTFATGKMYAMKEICMKRIKRRKAFELCWNEHKALKQLDSPFAVNLKHARPRRTRLAVEIPFRNIHVAAAAPPRPSSAEALYGTSRPRPAGTRSNAQVRVPVVEESVGSSD